ncbi:MAG: mechanosensitive ion channel [Myxococcota bacterium]|nr:mechanosensitive ion channel [Myxococcota bacterium]
MWGQLGIWWVIGWAGFIVAGTPLAAVAQSAEAAAVGVESEATEKPSNSGHGGKVSIQFVPMPEIGVRSEQAKQRIKETLLVTRPSEEEARAAEAIPDLRSWVNRQLHRSSMVRSHKPSVLSLDQLQAGWDQVNRRLEQTQNGLQEQGNKVEKQVQTLRKIKELWSDTRIKAVQLDVAPDVIRQIDEVLQAVKAASTEVNDRQAKLLALQSDVASLSELSDGDENLIAQSRGQAVSEVLERDVPPIWQPGFWKTADRRTVALNLQEQVIRDREILARYWDHNRQRVLFFGACVAGLIVLMWLARGRVDAAIGNEPQMQAVRGIFQKPIALSLLIAFFSSLWFFRDLAVGPLGPLFGAATLIPAVIVLRQIVDRPVYPMLSVGMVVYFVHHVHQLLEEAVVISRVLFLVNMSVLAVWTAWTLRPSRMKAIPSEVASKASFRAIGRILRVVSFAAFGCVAAELVGYGALAGLVGGTLMMGIYGAIVLYGTVLVVDGLLVFLMRVWPLESLALVRRNRDLLRERANLWMWLAAWAIIVQALLLRLEIWEQVKAAGRGLLAAQIPLPQVTLTVGNVVAAIVVFIGSMWASRFIQFVLSEEVFDSAEVERGRPYAIKTLLHYGFVIAGFIFAVIALGFDANRATLLTGAFGVGVGFGLQTIVNNFISGVILLTERPIQVGDTVAMGEVAGAIQRIGIRSSTVRTWQGAEVIVPNANFISEEVTNWTKSDRRRRFEIPIGVAYGNDPEVIMSMLAEAAASTEGVLETPEPYVLFQDFGDSSLDFEVRAWTSDFDHYSRIRSRICVSISRKLRDEGVEIPFPQRDIHLLDAPKV